MIAYFDTSALIPLVIDEPGSLAAGQLWDQADRVVSVRLVYAEARAALAQAQRLGRVTRPQLRRLVVALDEMYSQLDRIDVDDTLVRRAGELAQVHGLRGYDAVYLAGVERVADDHTVLVSAHQELCRAARNLGIAVSETSAGNR